MRLVDGAIWLLLWPLRNPLAMLRLTWSGIFRIATLLSVGYLVFDRVYVHYHSEEAAYAYVEARLWPDGPVCPHCGNVDAARIGKLQGKTTRNIGIFIYASGDSQSTAHFCIHHY
jgi:hypothetical protein